MASNPKRTLPTDANTAVAIAQRTYRGYYESCIKANRNKDSFATELLILVNGSPDVPEKYRLWRCDAIWKEDGKPQPAQFELDPPQSFRAITETHASGVRVTIHPIVWHRCEFRFSASESSWESVDRWQSKWLDQNDEKAPDNFGLARVIHWLSQPTREGDQVEFLVDFGSAPTAASTN